jgi:hypothetical protein
MTTSPAEVDSPAEQWLVARSEDEWLLMYVRRVSLPKIAAVCRVNHETVRYSIRQRERDGVEESTPDRVTTTFSTSASEETVQFFA